MVKVKNIRELEKAIERIVSKYLEKHEYEQYLTIQLPNQPPIPEDPTRAKLKAVINAFAYPATCIQPAESLLRKRGSIRRELENCKRVALIQRFLSSRSSLLSNSVSFASSLS